VQAICNVEPDNVCGVIAIQQNKIVVVVDVVFDFQIDVVAD
jgi:hypothetical protein